MPVVDVATIAELVAALAAATPGTVIRLAPGTYVAEAPLVVPDGVTLQSRGGVAMTYDGHGCPDQLAGPGLATIKADPALKGDLVRLENGAVLRRLRIEDVPGRTAGPQGWGNPVAVYSRRAGDWIDATIDRCEIVNALTTGVQGNQPGKGPEGRGLCILTRTNGTGDATDPHSGSTLRVKLVRTRILSPNNGLGIFANNFAARSRIMLRIERCRIAGGLDAVGGTSAPHVVTGAQTIILSSRTCYISEGPTPAGWGMLLNGGAIPPPASFQPLHTSNNLLVVESLNDRIEGFVTGVWARGATRSNASPVQGFVNGNRMILRMRNTIFLAIAQSDLSLVGGASNGDYPPGDENVLTLDMTGARGTDTPGDYWNTKGLTAPLPPQLSGGGNRLQVLGDPDSFAASNVDIAVPNAEFFL